MKTAPLLLLCLCAAALTLAQDEKDSKPPATAAPAQQFTSQQPKPKPKTTTTTAAPKTTATEAPKPTTTKNPPPKPATTKSPPPKPTTTKPPPPKPTTTKPPPPKPTTTKPPPPKPTTHKPTPAPPKPTPATNLTSGNYSLADKKVVCLLAQMALQIRLLTPKANGTFMVQPKLTKAQGFCSDNKANLTLVFTEGFITFLFNKSAEKNTAYVHTLSFDLSYPLDKAGGGRYKAANQSLQLFPAKIGHAYSCRAQAIYMGDGLYLDVNQDRMQAFNLTAAGEFGTSDPCAADQPDYRVAIAVGVTLLVLIAVVVVAYLLGRRRRSDGYQTL